MDNGASSYRRFLDGDDQGLAEIVRDYSDGLTLYLTGIVNDYAVAEELMEETLYKIITKRPQYHPTHTFKAWLYAIGRHTALDYLRRCERTELPLEGRDCAAGAGYDPEELCLADERKETLRRALTGLHSEYRQVLWLLYFEELSHTEAAAVMKKSPRQMKNLVYRAKIALRSELEKEGFLYEEV